MISSPFLCPATAGPFLSDPAGNVPSAPARPEPLVVGNRAQSVPASFPDRLTAMRKGSAPALPVWRARHAQRKRPAIAALRLASAFFEPATAAEVPRSSAPPVPER